MTDLNKILLPYTTHSIAAMSRPSLYEAINYPHRLSSVWWWGDHRVAVESGGPFGHRGWAVFIDGIVQHRNIASEQIAKDTLDQMLIYSGYTLLTQEEADKYMSQL